MRAHVLLWTTAIFCCLLTTYAETYEVSTAQKLIDLFSGPNKVSDTITLTNDLDFTGSSLTRPLGALYDKTCKTFRGVFNGNNHSIKGLKINCRSGPGYTYAGLFCGLDGAVVRDLTIDESCSFNGYTTGALAVRVSGSTTIERVTNKAEVTAGYGAGGLVGSVVSENAINPEIVFKDCMNAGNVTTTDQASGGLIGHCTNTIGFQITISHCVNNGYISGKLNIGGLVGLIQSNRKLSITISASTNNGPVNGNYDTGGVVGRSSSNRRISMNMVNVMNKGLISGTDRIGGLCGSVSNNGNVALITRGTNNGIVTGRNIVGGLFGTFSDNGNTDILISNSLNFGTVNCSQFSAGFIGMIKSQYKSTNAIITIVNSANKGTINGLDELSCGLFCVDPNNAMNVYTTVNNNINKGSVSGSNAYGLTNMVTDANNVVSMGKVTGSSTARSFWSISEETTQLYGLKNNCISCSGVTLFEHNSETGLYDVTDSNSQAHDLLNDEAKKEGYGMLWTGDLELEIDQTSSATVHRVSIFAFCLVLVLALL